MTRKTTVQIAVLKSKLSAYLKRAAKGDRLIVLDRDTPIAELGPLQQGPEAGGLQRLIGAGLVTPGSGRLHASPFAGMKPGVDVRLLLDEVRGER